MVNCGGRRCSLALGLWLCAWLAMGCDLSVGARPTLILATTTSTQDSGLLDDLVPLFEAASGYRVKTIAVGTGEALAMARRGDADVVLVHAPALEEESVAAGYTVNRRPVMHNEFLLVGPAADPALIRGSGDVLAALRRIATAGASFASRGDGSGTHFREQSLWRAAGLEPKGAWYLETGQGMGATLLLASEKQAYTLTDRGTYLALRERCALETQVPGDPRLHNLYSVMEVNPERFPRVDHAGARRFGDFLSSEPVQGRISRFGVERFGEPLFFPGPGTPLVAQGG